MATGDSDFTQIRCIPKNPCLLLQKLVELMEHPISENATERHLQLLREFIQASHYSYWLHDIPYIIRLYENIVKRLDTIAEYKVQLKRLLNISSFPPMMEKLSEKIPYARDYEEYFSVLGYLILCLHEFDLKVLILKAIRDLLTPDQPNAFCCVTVEDTKQAVEKSKLPEIVAQLVQVVQDDLYPALLEVIYLICEISQSSCKKMLEQNPIEYLLQRLEPTWRERDLDTKPEDPSYENTIYHLEDTCCVLWKLLHVLDDKQNVPNPSSYALWSLQYAFRWTSICPEQKKNRNDLASLILKILLAFPTIDLKGSDLAEEIALCAVASAGCCCVIGEFKEDRLDFQFKKIIWACLHLLKRNRVVEEFPMERDILNAFTNCLFNKHAVSKKNLAQHCEFSKILLKLLPKFLVDVDLILELKAPLKIMQIMEAYLQNSYDIQLLEAYMYCLHLILPRLPKEVIENICKNHAGDIVTSICNKILELPTLSTVYQRALARGFCILQLFGETVDISNFDQIHLCVNYLNRMIQLRDDDPLVDLRVTVCALHLLWGNIKTETFHQEFLKLGGIYILLDIIQSSSSVVKTPALGILADSSKYSSSIPYLITWRKRGTKLLPLLMKIFRNKTENRCDSPSKTKINEKKLDNFNLALCEEKPITLLKNCTTPPDLLYSLRCKIHSILDAVKIKYKDKVQVADQHYKLFNDKLESNDALTMLFAENFLSLKMCEAWINVSKELADENVVPVDEDNDHLNEKVARIRQWKTYLRGIMEDITRNDKRAEQSSEFSLYNTLKEARLSEALDALQEMRYISKCTERMFQMKKKMLQVKQIGPLQGRNYNFHRTFTDLPFTNIFDQQISIQSNVVHNRKEEEPIISPVSSDSDFSLESRTSKDELSEHQLEC